MHIKDVEKQTGLSAKSIRFYEDKGLLKVARNHNNSYRNYSEDNVQTLKKIKLFRYFDFSVGEIAELLTSSSEEFNDQLTVKLDQLDTEREQLNVRHNLLKTYLKESHQERILEEYYQTIAYLESEEYEELKTLPFTVVSSLSGMF